MKPIILIPMGDPAGIGPEIAARRWRVRKPFSAPDAWWLGTDR